MQAAQQQMQSRRRRLHLCLIQPLRCKLAAPAPVTAHRPRIMRWEKSVVHLHHVPVGMIERHSPAEIPQMRQVPRVARARNVALVFQNHAELKKIARVAHEIQIIIDPQPRLRPCLRRQRRPLDQRQKAQPMRQQAMQSLRFGHIARRMLHLPIGRRGNGLVRRWKFCLDQIADAVPPCPCQQPRRRLWNRQRRNQQRQAVRLPEGLPQIGQKVIHGGCLYSPLRPPSTAN